MLHLPESNRQVRMIQTIVSEIEMQLRQRMVHVLSRIKNFLSFKVPFNEKRRTDWSEKVYHCLVVRKMVPQEPYEPLLVHIRRAPLVIFPVQSVFRPVAGFRFIRYTF
jgi:hypothetical protein